MELLLEFIYCGEAILQQEELENFIKTGEELKVKGLSVMITPTGPRMSPSKFISCPDEVSGPDLSENAVSSTQFEGRPSFLSVGNPLDPTEVPLEPDVNVKSEEFETYQDPNIEVKKWDDLEKFVVVIKNGKYGSGKLRQRQCSLCGKISKAGKGRARMDMMHHIENKHYKNVLTHTCDVCQKTFQSRGLLISHTKHEHKSQI